VAPTQDAKEKESFIVAFGLGAQSEQVEFGWGGSGVWFDGKIAELKIGSEPTDFVFVGEHGVKSTIFTDLFDDVSTHMIPSCEPVINLNSKSDHTRSVTIVLKKVDASREQKLGEVCSQFRTWIKLETLLRTHSGNTMLSTLCKSSIKEVSPGKFIFSVADTETAYLVAPTNSDLMSVSKENDVTLVTLLNLKSGFAFVAVDGMESPEETIDRFAALTMKLQ
jgi:hypothetical protein